MKRPSIVNDLTLERSKQSLGSAGSANYRLKYQDHEEIEVHTHLDTSVFDRTLNPSQTMTNMIGMEAEDNFYPDTKKPTIQYQEEVSQALMHNELRMTSKMNSNFMSKRSSARKEPTSYSKTPQLHDLDDKRRRTFEMIRLAKN